MDRPLAPLSPSIGIRCRFCGIGKYERRNIYKDNHMLRYVGVPAAETFADMPGGETGILRCSHCGHIEWFQLKGIAQQGWWDR